MKAFLGYGELGRQIQAFLEEEDNEKINACFFDDLIFVEAGVLINNSVTVSHNSTIGACSYISPGVIISGNVQIGSACFIGTGSLISNGITIGNNSTIGIGSVITHNIPPNSNILGNPAKFLNKPLKLL